MTENLQNFLLLSFLVLHVFNIRLYNTNQKMIKRQSEEILKLYSYLIKKAGEK